MARCCDTCRFWLAPPKADRTGIIEMKGEYSGQCRRYPRMHLDASYLETNETYGADAATETVSAWLYPITEETDYCGEWRDENQP